MNIRALPIALSATRPNATGTIKGTAEQSRPCANRELEVKDGCSILRGSGRYCGLVAASACLVALLWLFGGGSAAADVTPVGGFATQLKVEVPEFHGIEPGIAFTYDSSQGNGLMGVGWRLEAGSYISRTGTHGGAPRFDGNDVFRIDGEELVACGSSCPSGGTHETRVRDFTRISFDGNRWVQLRPDGVRLEYDQLPLANAKGPYRWALSAVIDTHGNRVSYSHDCDGTDCYLRSIAYADGPERCTWHFDPLPTRVCLPGPEGARIRFYYKDRPDPVSYGTGIDLAVTTKRLETVEVRMAGELARAYALRYEESGSTGSSLLKSVQTFPSDATVSSDGTVSAGATTPLPPTVFSTASMYRGPQENWVTFGLPTKGLSSFDAAGPENPEYGHVFKDISIRNRAGSAYDPQHGEVVELSSGSLPGDFDGDGRTDIAFWSMPSCSSDVHITTVLADRPKSPVETGPEPDPRNARPCSSRLTAFSGDLNGDGIDDVMVMGSQLRGLLGTGGGGFVESSKTTEHRFLASLFR
jgi:hypothetical protein